MCGTATSGSRHWLLPVIAPQHLLRADTPALEAGMADAAGDGAGRKFHPPAGVPRPPFNTAYPPPRPDFDAMSDDEELAAAALGRGKPPQQPLVRQPGSHFSLAKQTAVICCTWCAGPEPEPESAPGGVMAEESAPPAKPTMERKSKPKAAARPRSPEFKVHREEVEEILEKPRFTAGWYRKAGRIAEEKIKTGYGVTAEEQEAVDDNDRGEDVSIKLPGERPVSPEARETWSLVYQEPNAMMEDLHEFGDVNAADRAGWTALHWAALLGKEGHVRLLLDSDASIRARSRISVGRDVRAPNEAQVAVRIPKGATPLDVAAAAMDGIASTKAGAKTVGTGVLTSAPLATGHSLIHAWLHSAESELVRQEETAKWEQRVAEQAQKLTQVSRHQHLHLHRRLGVSEIYATVDTNRAGMVQNERDRREAATAERYEAAQQAVADSQVRRGLV